MNDFNYFQIGLTKSHFFLNVVISNLYLEEHHHLFFQNLLDLFLNLFRYLIIPKL